MYFVSNRLLHKTFIFFIAGIAFIKFADTSGWICWKGVEVDRFQAGPCNPLEQELLLCFHVSESKHRRMPICSLSCVPWGTIQNTEENKGKSSKRWWFDGDLSSRVTQSTVMCRHLVVYERLFGWSALVRTCQGLCFLWENVHSGGKVNHFFVRWINPKICFCNLLRVNPKLPAKLEKKNLL